MGYGRYFEEFVVGEVYKHWPGRTITEHDDTWFSLMTMASEVFAGANAPTASSSVRPVRSTVGASTITTDITSAPAGSAPASTP